LKGIKRGTLSYAMQNRPYEIFEGIFDKLLEKCQSVTPKHRFKFKNPLYSLDSTVIHLCLSIFPWARFRKRKGAIKLHYLYDYSGSLPTFMTMTDGKTHDIRVAKCSQKLNFALLPDSINRSKIKPSFGTISSDWPGTIPDRNIPLNCG